LLKDPPVLGTWAIAGWDGGLLVRATQRGVREIRFVSPADVRNHQRTSPPADALPWMPELLAALEEYLAGKRVSFDDIPVDLTSQPPFRRRVQEACRRIPYGQTLTYGQLAAKAGNPAAVRAVGSAMSHNPLPILIPCHRVVRSNGGIGGFSARGGTDLKQRLLDMERRNISSAASTMKRG
jgi:methylated-DNA-[protein]-cysteine S-methyltransferase